MDLIKILRNAMLVVFASLVLSACATQKVSQPAGQMQGDV